MYVSDRVARILGADVSAPAGALKAQFGTLGEIFGKINVNKTECLLSFL